LGWRQKVLRGDGVFKHINKFIDQMMRSPIRRVFKTRPLHKLNSSGGQVAIILIFIIAISLIFYAVILNLGSISDAKVMATIGSNVGGARLASQMASYGHNLVMTYLEGSRKKCAWTGLAIIFLIIFIFAPYLAFLLIAINSLSPVGGLVAAAVLGMFLGMPLILFQGIIFLQSEVIEAGLTKKWNAQKAGLSTTDNFLESAISMGLLQAVDDEVKVPDVIDFDSDLVWGYNGSNQPQDYLGRYGMYYNYLMDVVAGQATAYNFPQLEAFINSLKEFIYRGTDNWGIYDPWKDACSTTGSACCYNPLSTIPVPSVCNPCCLPQSSPNPNGTTPLSLRPKCCDTGVGQCGTSSTCAAQSPYGATHPWVYNPTHDNSENTFVSVKELLGFDDEHQLFSKDPFAPNSTQFLELVGEEGFYIKDATNYYIAPPMPTRTDNREGIFPYFHKLTWGVDLATLDIAGNTDHCYWYDNIYEPACSTVVLPQELSNTQLRLSQDPATLTYGTNPWVDSVANNVAGNPPLAPDKIILPENIVAFPDQCVHSVFDAGGGFFKPGSDRFCSTDWPYYVNCPKNQGGCTGPDGSPKDCLCGEGGANPVLFPEDILDDFVYGFIELVSWAEALIQQYEFSPTAMAADVNLWYPRAAEWIGPTGNLVVWRNELATIAARLDEWKNTSFAAGSCNEAWCTPPAGCPGVSPEEEATSDSNANGIAGDLEDIVACLNYNIEGYNYTTASINPVGTDQGRSFIYSRCAKTCSNECAGLPRSIIPPAQYDPGAYSANDPLDDLDLLFMARCFNSCSVAACSVLPLNNTSTGAPYVWPAAPSAFTAADCSAAPGWLPGNLWYDALVANQFLANPFNDPLDFPDLSAMLSCYGACSAINCTTLPAIQSSTLLPYAWPGDPTTFADANCAAWAPGNPWYDAIVANAFTVNPVCDLNPTGWLGLTWQSSMETDNQVAKFRQRRNYLSGRVEELKKIIPMFRSIEAKFSQFLNGPVAAFIAAKNAQAGVKRAMPYSVIYGWQDEKPPKRAAPDETGLWHIVKVDARTPGRCDNACGVNGGADPPFPSIRTYTRKWGLERCYELRDEAGMVKFRAVRFDEVRHRLFLLRFPNGSPIWDFRAFHPGRRQVYDTASLSTVCVDQVLPDPPVPLPTGTSDILKGAFIMWEKPTDAAGITCWDFVHDLLTAGVMSETCARYGWTDAGMDFHFVRCPVF
jgi:hypothetical protein